MTFEIDNLKPNPKKNSSSLLDSINTHSPITDKRARLKQIKSDCFNLSKEYKKKYKKIKKIDEILDALNAFLSASSISCTIAGITIPPLLIASAGLSGIGFIINRIQDKINYKSKYTQHNLSVNQYSSLCREISSVLSKNNLTTEQYQAYIEEINDKMNLISDSALII